MEASKTQNAQQKWNSHVPRSSDFFVDCASWCYSTCILGLFRFSFPVWSLSINFLIRIETQVKSKTNIATILFEVQIVKPQNVMSKENIYFGYFIKPGKQLGTAFPAYISNILVQWECPCFGYPSQCTSAVGLLLFWGILSRTLVGSLLFWVSSSIQPWRITSIYQLQKQSCQSPWHVRDRSHLIILSIAIDRSVVSYLR